jgi:hypothetical protein
MGAVPCWLPSLEDCELVAQDQDFRRLRPLLALDSRGHAATRVTRRNANRRHIIVDLHG